MANCTVNLRVERDGPITGRAALPADIGAIHPGGYPQFIEVDGRIYQWRSGSMAEQLESASYELVVPMLATAVVDPSET